MKEEDIVIVGGGPAGAYLAYLLAKDGIEVTIFDDSHPREKPCGGGISPKALEKFPILGHVPYSKRIVTSVILISPKNCEITLTKKTSCMNVSRMHLDKYLLDKAIDEGANLIEERVTDAKQKNFKWILKTNKRTLKTKLVIGADGTKSIIRKKVVGDIPHEHLAICRGYFTKRIEEDYNLIKFLGKGRGYIWVFPREDHTSIGIGVDIRDSRNILHQLNEFIKLRYPYISILSQWGALIPQIESTDFYKIPCADKNWIIIGDAAGHVDPVTGEGIFYALWSAKVAYEAITNENPKLFDKLWREEYGKDLIMGVKLSKIFHNPLFLEFSIKMVPRNKTYSQILLDILTGRQQYSTIIRRGLMDIPNIVFELLKIR